MRHESGYSASFFRSVQLLSCALRLSWPFMSPVLDLSFHHNEIGRRKRERKQLEGPEGVVAAINEAVHLSVPEFQYKFMQSMVS